MLSIGLILPILNLLFNENYLSQQNQISEITNQIGEFNFIVISLLFLFGLYVFKAIILLYFILSETYSIKNFAEIGFEPDTYPSSYFRLNFQNLTNLIIKAMVSYL